MYKRSLPDDVGLLDALEIRVDDLEHQARTDGEAFWESEGRADFEETGFAFLLRSTRSLLHLLRAGPIVPAHVYVGDDA